LLPQGEIGQGQGGHGFDYGNGPGQDAGVVPAFTFQNHLTTIITCGFLGFAYSRYRFKGNAEINQLTVADHRR